MAKKEPCHIKPLYENKKNIIRSLIEEYDIETAEDIQEALKDLLGGMIKSMVEAEMTDHLGYKKSERSETDNYRNGAPRRKLFAAIMVNSSLKLRKVVTAALSQRL